MCNDFMGFYKFYFIFVKICDIMWKMRYVKTKSMYYNQKRQIYKYGCFSINSSINYCNLQHIKSKTEENLCLK